MDTQGNIRKTATWEHAGASCAAVAEWNRFDHDYSGLWHMFDKEALPHKQVGKNMS